MLILQKYLCTSKVAKIHDVQWISKMSCKYLIVSDILSAIWKSAISILVRNTQVVSKKLYVGEINNDFYVVDFFTLDCQ